MKMNSFLTLVYVWIVCVNTIRATNQWPNHDISTLRLLQIVHRHGDRAPTTFPPNDPYADVKYWPEGVSQLSTKGKYRMYKFGQFVRQEYNDYLGDKYSPREVYARSSITERCLESVSALLAGAYPPKRPEWQWNNGSDGELGAVWQPFPIETFMPKVDDLILNQDKLCLAVVKELAKINNRSAIKDFVNENMELYANVSKVVGKPIVDIGGADSIHGTLSLEMDRGLYWTQYWTEDEERRIVEQLYYSHLMTFRNNWDSDVIKRLRAGGLVRELNKNINNVLDNSNDKRLYVYSTHDTQLGALMHALNIFNDRLVPFGAALIFELHESHDLGHFMKLYYHNSTEINAGVPYLMQWTDCDNKTECPLELYFNSTQHLLYDNFDDECNKSVF